jgi:hypothetical protein
VAAVIFNCDGKNLDPGRTNWEEESAADSTNCTLVSKYAGMLLEEAAQTKFHDTYEPCRNAHKPHTLYCPQVSQDL